MIANITFKIFFFILLFTLLSWKFSENDLKEIEILLERTDTVLFLPERFTFVPVIKNKQVAYHFAYKLENDIEVRYLILPLDSALSEYDAYLERKAIGKTRNDSIVKEARVDPNNSYKSVFMAILFNICKKNDSSMSHAQRTIDEFPLTAVQKEFNADYGLHAFCELDPEFGQKNKFCNVFMIHKKDYGDIYCFRIFKDAAMVDKLFKDNTINKEFYNLLFIKSNPQIKEYPRGKSRIVKF
jgi:hypothetical protein